MPLTKTFNVEKTTSFDLLNLTAVRGRSYAEGAQRDSGAIPLRVPAYRLRAVEQFTSVVAPGLYWRKGLLRFWLTAGFIPDLFCS